MFWPKKIIIPARPPQTVKNGQLIHGRLFPWNVRGFINFDYNEVFKDIPWNTSVSWWEMSQIIWNGGTIPFRENLKTKQITQEYDEKRIHKRWRDLGYFPTFWRVAYTSIPEEDAIGKNVENEIWPRPKFLFYEPNQYVLVFFGEVVIHELCRPIPWKRNEFQRDFSVNPGKNCRLFNYCHYDDLLIEIIKEDEYTNRSAVLH